MGAGDSARREYERRRERDAEARRRALPYLAAGAFVGAVVVYFLLEQWVDGLGWIGAAVVILAAVAELRPKQSTEAWRIGADGEAAVAKTLAKVESGTVKVLHDRKVPGSSANIDHLVVCGSGVFVVDAKKYKGELKAGRGTITVNGRDRSNLLRAMDRQLAVVRAALEGTGYDALPVTPVLCFVGTELPWGRTSVNGVRITHPRGLKRLVSKEGELTGEQVMDIADLLARRLPRA
ncbi:MAG: nuclease-related domain-containing protein [Nitriliruptorales bacterium]|nr:nuclease-related domain-containing protein [Nitriliruptorales bacterium]